MPNLHIYPDRQALIEAVAQRWFMLAQSAIEQRGCFHVALAGGSTPTALYEQLRSPDWIDKINWSAVHIWFGDERCVPSDHPDSNYRMASEALLSHVPIPRDQIHPMKGGMGNPQEAATEYSKMLLNQIHTNKGLPHFDLIMLGIGTDGHIASLFPGSANLHEQHRTVSAAWIDEQKGWRISLTLPTIIHAAHIMLMANGEEKTAILQQVFRDSPKETSFPASHIRDLPQTEWHLDALAARLIPST
jgi:6-phosphogluconolactonase